jgi:four helix bundle protein
MDIKSYKDMIVWQKSMDLAIEIYKLVKLLPKEETFALSDQMRRAAVSIPSNIAEGQSRNKTKEFIRFLSIARGSNAELFTQLLICEKVGYLSENQTLYAKSASSEISKMLAALINKLSAER